MRFAPGRTLPDERRLENDPQSALLYEAYALRRVGGLHTSVSGIGPAQVWNLFVVSLVGYFALSCIHQFAKVRARLNHISSSRLSYGMYATETSLLDRHVSSLVHSARSTPVSTLSCRRVLAVVAIEVVERSQATHRTQSSAVKFLATPHGTSTTLTTTAGAGAA